MEAGLAIWILSEGENLGRLETEHEPHPALEIARERGLRPRVLMPVHFAGHPCDMDALIRIAGDHGLAIVEDAAHALPATFRGSRN